MLNTQILPSAFYGLQNFLDNFNACNAQGECAYTPKADYYEVDNGFVLEVELPGVKKEDLDVQVEKNIIASQEAAGLRTQVDRGLTRRL